MKKHKITTLSLYMQGSATGRLLKVLVICTLGFVLWKMLRNEPEVDRLRERQASSLAREQTAEAAAPVYRDKNGKRITEIEHQLMLVRETAERTGINSHAQCKEQFKYLEKLECDRYVTAHRYFPPHVRQANWDSGKTTAQCREEVAAYWDARIKDSEEMGESFEATWSLHRDRGAEWEECKNYDNVGGALRAMERSAQ